MQRALVVGLIFSLIFAVPACGGKEDGGGGASATGATSPEALLDKMEGLMTSKDADFVDFVSIMHPDDQPPMAISMSLMPMMFIGFATMMGEGEEKAKAEAALKDLEAMFAKHGLDKAQAEALQKDPENADLSTEEKKKKLNELAKGIDHMALLREAMAIMDRLEGEKTTEVKFDAAAFKRARDSLKVDGDRATMLDPEGGPNDVVMLKASDGFWYVSATESKLFDKGM